MLSKLLSKFKELIASLLVVAVMLTLAPMGAALADATTCPTTASVQALPSLKAGMRSTAVTTLQQGLMCLGYNISSATGFYGPQTTAAVLKFYQDKGNAAGVALGGKSFGPQGRSLLATAVGGAPAPVPGGTSNQALIALLQVLAAQNPSLAATINALIATLTAAPVTPVSGNVTVALDASNPAAGNIVADVNDGGQGLVPVLRVNVSNGTTSTVNITSVTVHRTGLSSDSDIDNAYLFDHATGLKLADMASFSTGAITFTGSPIVSIPAGGNKILSVKIDLNKGASAGKTIVFQLTSASDISAGATISGTFPIVGNAMTVATVSDLGKLSVATTTNATAVDPGTTGFAALNLQVQGQNQPIRLNTITFKQLGSIAANALANYSLFDGATQIGTATLDSNNNVTFTLTNYVIASGVTKNLQLRVDVLGGSNTTMQFSLLNSSYVSATDTNYNVSIRPYTGTVGTFSALAGNTVTVNTGSVVVLKASTSPMGNVIMNGTNVKLGEYSVTAYGEPLKVQSVTFQVSGAGGPQWTSIKNVRIIVNGSQVGTTQVTVASSTSYTVNTNFILPVGQTQLLDINADVQGSADFNSTALVQAVLIAGSGNALRMNSNIAAGFPGANVSGNVLTVAAGALAATANPGFAAGTASYPTAVTGQQAVRVASFILSNNGPEAMQVQGLPFTDESSAFSSLSNLYMNFNGTKIGNTVAALTTGSTYTFTPANILSVAAYSQATVDVYANVNSGLSAGAKGDVKINAVSATGATSGQSTSTSAVSGQAVYVAGSGTLTNILVTSDTPVAQYLVMGTQGVTLGKFQFDASTSSEAIDLTQLVLTDNQVGDASNQGLNTIQLMNGSTVVSSVVALSGNQATFNLSQNPLQVVKGSTLTLSVIANLSSFPTAPNSTHQAQFAISSISYRGDVSGVSTTTPAATLSGNVMTLRRSKLTLQSYAFSGNGNQAGRLRTAGDWLGTIIVNANPAANVNFATVTIGVSGNALNVTQATSSNVYLVDSSTGLNVATATVTFSSTSQSVTANLVPSSPLISAGTSKTYKVLVDENLMATGTVQNPVTLNLQLANTSAIHWTVVGDTTDNVLDLTGGVTSFPTTVTVTFTN